MNSNNLKLLILILIFKSAFIELNAQSSKIDSLENIILSHTNEDTIRVEALVYLTNEIYATNSEQSFKYASEALEISKSLNYKRGISRSSHMIGLYYQRKSDYDKALEYYFASMEIYKKLNSKKSLSSLYNNIGNIYRNLADYPKALEFIEKSIAIKEELGNKAGISNGYNNIGGVYDEWGNFSKALEYYKKSLQIAEQMDNWKLISRCQNNIGILFYEMKEYDKALEYFKKSLKLCEENKMDKMISRRLTNIGIIYEKQNKLDSSLIYFGQSIEIAKKIEFAHILGYAYNGKGTIFEKKQQYDKALEFYELGLQIRESIGEKNGTTQSLNNIGNLYLKMSNYEQSLKYLKKAFLLAEDISSPGNLREASEGLASIYKHYGNYEKSLEYYTIFKQMNDSLLNEENIKKIASFEISMQFEREKQAMEMEQLKKDAAQAIKNKRQAILIYSSLTGLVLMAVIAILILRSYRQKRRSNELLEKQNHILQDQNHEIQQLNEELQTANEELHTQKEELHTQKEELEKHRNHLEKLVNERTADLEVAKNKAEESDRLKSAFLANISHEIRTPMNAIVGFSSTLDDSNLSEKDKQASILLIQHNCSSLLQLIDDILNLAMIEAGQLKLKKKEFNINQFLNELFNVFLENKNATEDKKDIELKLNVSREPEGFKMFSDPVRIQQIFTYMMDNAIKFTKKGLIEFGYLLNGSGNDAITFFVKDSGVGISKEKIGTIFDRFIKIDVSKDKFYRGTGVGLAICKDLVELLEGKIWVDSEVNKGSSFYFSIPLKPN